ncbi:MAG: FkbM family methyltransferase [Nanoarchaeota archaeon]
MRLGSFYGFEYAYREQGCDEYQLRQNPAALLIPEFESSIDDVIIDVGAHIGSFSIPASRLVPQGRVHALEPCNSSFLYLTKNIAMNSIPNVIPYQLALSDKKSRMRLNYYPDDTEFGDQNWGNTLTKEFDEGEEVQTDTLPNFLKDQMITDCAFMKLNCEGSEFEILLGTPTEYLRKTDLYLVLYHLDLNEHHTVDELIWHFESNGFKTQMRNKEQKRGWLIAKKT